ncbi:DNA polymerase I [Strigomonas culicis]|uniref:DNA polymerase I n=1 Tax=Strigomonas culicis TaxID=28005 RepID=S9TRN0_9TRYP|nr:DNA polymerase I [Strigomonas culicis]|eukprot:EPY19259.1 DNA polymerase I [Strigomonas culicis]
MRRLLNAVWRRVDTRSACSFENLVKAQTLLQSNKALNAKAAAEFSEYFHIPRVKGKNSEKAVTHFFKETCKQIENDKLSNLVRLQHEETTKGNDLPIFLASCDPKTESITLFSVMKEERVAVVQRDGDMWGLADDILRHTRGVPRIIIIPIIASEEERAAAQSSMEWLRQSLQQQGLLPVTHVDNQMLVSSFTKSPPPLKQAKRKKASVASDEWFQSQWMYLQTVTCHAEAPDPVKALNMHICPQFDVFVVHLVRAGSRTLNISLWHPARRQRHVAKGMLSDVLSCLFSTHSKHVILVPTIRTDRPTLFRCRTALLKSGVDCAIVFASSMNDKYRQAYDPDPSRYWLSLREATDSLDPDLLFEIQKAAGNNIREFEQKRMQVTEAKVQELSDKTSEVRAQTSATTWLAPLSQPSRAQAELREAGHYAHYLVIAFTATDHAAYGQPHNPTAACNYILSTCLLDAHGHLLEPWRVLQKRGAYRLPSLKGVDVLVLHGAKPFLLHVWGDEELRLFLRRGGRVWCTQLAEYLLDAQRCHTGCNDLNTVALRYGALVPPGSVIGVEQESLPLAFHRHYLLKAAPAVLLFFQQQLKRAVAQHQLISIAQRMNSLLAMAAMEHAGIHIDVAEARRQSKALGNLINTMDRALDAYVPAEVPMDMRMHFDWGSPTHLHAYFFGGKIALGHTAAARESRLWTSNLVHLCHRFGSFNKLIGELHLQRFAAQHGLPTKGSLPQRISSFFQKNGSASKKKYRLVLLDIETTGLNVSTDEIIEIALYDPVENTSFSSLIKPKRKITPKTVRIHHITNEAVASAPPIEKVVEGVAKYLRVGKGAEHSDEVVVLMGHNVFSLDEPMLRRAFDTHFTDSAHDGILYCDSIALLRALRLELQHSKASDVKVDHALLETLTSSLRLSSLIEKLRVVPEGTLHRAVTDTKALWFVLVQAFHLQGLPPPKQRDALLAKATDSLIAFPTTGCFMPTERKRPTAEVHLPGVAHRVIEKPKFLSSLAAKPFSDTILETLHVRGVKEAELVLQRYHVDQHAVRFLQMDKESLCTLHPDSKVRQHIDMTATKTHGPPAATRAVRTFQRMTSLPSAASLFLVTGKGQTGRGRLLAAGDCGPRYPVQRHEAIKGFEQRCGLPYQAGVLLQRAAVQGDLRGLSPRRAQVQDAAQGGEAVLLPAALRRRHPPPAQDNGHPRGGPQPPHCRGEGGVSWH